ncbi:MAG: hypothetical protein ABH872_03880 [Candidatus Omnitrophota bacterium]
MSSICENKYQEYFKEQEKKRESFCVRCGGCCGSFDDPCLHLKKDIRNQYRCEIYSKRFGLRKTINGEKFYCVPLREIINSYWENDYLCAYKKSKKYSWMASGKQLSQ